MLKKVEEQGFLLTFFWQNDIIIQGKPAKSRDCRKDETFRR
jgi:hypothetical protein